MNVLFRGDGLVVLDKPSGLPSVPGRDPARQDSAYTRVLTDWPAAKVVHRLDRGTSGVLVFALDAATERNLDRQFQRRRVQKHYVALVEGHPPEDEGRIDLPLLRESGTLISRVCVQQGKEAVTRYRVRQRRDDGTALLDLFPETGRTHQLRVHLQAIGHPILGDAFYAPPAAVERAPRLMLHALSLSLHRPGSGERITFTAPLPGSFLADL